MKQAYYLAHHVEANHTNRDNVSDETELRGKVKTHVAREGQSAKFMRIPSRDVSLGSVTRAARTCPLSSSIIYGPRIRDWLGQSSISRLMA